MIKVTAIHAFADNYIWLIGRDGNSSVAIVDPGTAEPVLAALEQHGLRPCAILTTHHHFDHTAGISELLEHFDIPVYGPANEPIPFRTHPLKEGDRVELGELGLTFDVWDTPGHTSGHIAYLGHGCLFCGDTLFTAGCGRLFEGTPEEMQHSLARIRELPDETRVYCAHEYTLDNIGFALMAEPENQELRQRREEAIKTIMKGKPTVPSELGLEKRTNPFLRWDSQNLVKAAEEIADKKLNTPVEVFGMVRAWKDSLD